MTRSSDLPAELAHQMLSLPGATVSRHWEELLNKNEHHLPEIITIGWCIDTLSKMSSIMRKLGETRKIVWVIGIGETEDINISSPRYIFDQMISLSEIAIYSFEGENIFEDVPEEYRRYFIDERFDGLFVLYRSWRSQRAALNGWAYSNDVYLWSNADVHNNTTVS